MKLGSEDNFILKNSIVQSYGETCYLNSVSGMGYMTTFKIFVGKCMTKLRLKF
jgi:hypothetical protein